MAVACLSVCPSVRLSVCPVWDPESRSWKLARRNQNDPGPLKRLKINKTSAPQNQISASIKWILGCFCVATKWQIVPNLAATLLRILSLASGQPPSRGRLRSAAKTNKLATSFSVCVTLLKINCDSFVFDVAPVCSTTCRYILCEFVALAYSCKLRALSMHQSCCTRYGPPKNLAGGDIHSGMRSDIPIDSRDDVQADQAYSAMYIL